jgi:AcrR family transcriptional regulator
MANEQIKIRNLEHTIDVTFNLLLQYGIESLTKEMIARESGLSRKSIDRYFSSKVDCIMAVAENALEKIRAEELKNFPDGIFENGEYTGIQLLKKYMEDLKRVFLAEPRLLVLYNELKIYIYRHGKSQTKDYATLIDWLGNRQLRKKIYKLGKEDGTIKSNNDVSTEEYFAESFFGFLSNLAMSCDSHSAQEIEEQINKRIANTIALYSTNLD